MGEAARCQEKEAEERAEGTEAGEAITEHGELGPPGAQRGLRGLAFVRGIVRELGVCDLQVVLPGVRGAHDPVPRPGCRDRKGEPSVSPSPRGSQPEYPVLTLCPLLIPTPGSTPHSQPAPPSALPGNPSRRIGIKSQMWVP